VLKQEFLFITIILVFLSLASNIKGQESPEVQQPGKLTGNWSGVRNFLVNKGICLDAIYTGEIVSNLQGGIRHGSSYLDVVDLMLAINFDRVVPWKGTSVYLDVFGTHGSDPCDCVGDFQGVSNITARSTWKLYEAWIQQNFLNEKFSILWGIYDVNSEFDVLETAGLFLNSSFGMGAEFAKSGKKGPSTFPSTSLGLRMKTQWSEHFCFQAAVIDGVPDEPEKKWRTKFKINKDDGALITSEIIFITDKERVRSLPWHSKRKKIYHQQRGFGKHRTFFQKSNDSKGRGQKLGNRQRKYRRLQDKIPINTYSKFAIGGWYYTSDFENFDSMNPLQYKGSWGIYGLWEKSVFFDKENAQPNLSYFLRVGISDENVNQVDKYIGGGIVHSGIFSQLHHDQMGVAIAAAHTSDKFKQAILKNGEQLDNWEMAIEVSYRAEISGWFSIQPDLQYIINPGFNPALKDAITFGFRTEICF
jgi:porin